MAALVHYHAVFDPPSRKFVVTVTLTDQTSKQQRRFQSRMPPRDFETFAANFRGASEVGGYVIDFKEEQSDSPCYGSGDFISTVSRELRDAPNVVEQIREYLMKVWAAYRNWCIYRQISIY